MDPIGRILKEIKITQKELPPICSDDLSKYSCIICKDTEQILTRKNVGGGKFDPDPDFPAGHVLTDEEWIRQVKPEHANRWNSYFEHCSCYRKKIEQRKAEELLGSTLLSKRFQKRSFENFIFMNPKDFPRKLQPSVEELVDGQRKAFELATEYCSHYDEMQEHGWGFGLWGDYGTGKSHLLGAKTLYLKAKKVNSIYVNTADLFEEIRSSYEVGEDGSPTGKRKRSELIDLIKTAEDLSLDDVGTENPKEWIKEIFYLILNHRYENLLTTSFTTNNVVEELQLHLGKSYRRLIEPCLGDPGQPGRMVFIKGPSFDQIRKEMKVDPDINFR